MDLKTLIISALVVCLATNLSLGMVYLTRRTYSGFGDWLAGTICRSLAAILFILPRDSLPPWLTIILPNWLMIVEPLLYLRGTRRFYGQPPPSVGWAVLATLLYLPVFHHYTYTVPDINARFVVVSVFDFVFSLAMIGALLTHRPPYAGASEKYQAGLWALITAESLFRGGYLLLGDVGPMRDFAGVPPLVSVAVLVISFNALLIAISQIIMNAQRLEYDHELALERLEQDIIEREKADAAIRDQERLFSSNFNLSLMGMAITSLEKGWVKVNDRLCQILGYSREALQSRTWAELTHPDDLAADVAQFNRVMSGEIPGYSMEKRFIRPDGQVVPTLMSVACVRAASGRPEYFVAQIHDISQRVEIEAALRQSETTLRLAFEYANSGMCLVDMTGRMMRVNAKMCDIFGYGKAELEAMTVNDLVLPEDADVSPRFMERARQGVVEQSRFEKRYHRRDGEVITCEVASSLVRDHDGEPLYFISHVQDISERKHHESELRRAREAADAANRAKSQFLAHMSHEIRTPMNGVLGMAQLLAHEPLTPDQAEMVSNIRSAGRSLLSVINDILDFSKIEAGQLHIETQPFELSRKLGNVVKILSVMARDKGIALTLEPLPVIEGHLLGDAMRLEQVLFNLVGNALKFTKQGGVTIRIGLVTIDPAQVRLRFEIEDTGIGMSQETLDRLFTPFTQADASITRRFGGTGLGLTISKRLIEMMGGLINASSVEGRGSRFWFELPFARELDTLVEPAEDNLFVPVATTDVTSRYAPRKALVVDDNSINRQLMARILKREGIESTQASDGQQALDLLRAAPNAFDVVFMDVQMPVVDGLAATRQIRHDARLAHLPVIALTAGVLAQEREAATAAGMDGFLAKPLDIEQMKELLQRLENRPRPNAPS